MHKLIEASAKCQLAITHIQDPSIDPSQTDTAAKWEKKQVERNNIKCCTLIHM